MNYSKRNHSVSGSNGITVDRHRKHLSRRRLYRPLAFLTLLFGLLAAVPGCGESQQDLFMKHASRTRDEAADEEQETAAPSTQPDQAIQNAALVGKASPAQPMTPGTQPAKLPGSSEPIDTASLAEELGIKPISERKPDSELAVTERRKRSVANLKKIYEAMDAYRYQHRGYLPRAFRVSPGGLPTLSWRVEILPYLGYEKLYAKFDFNRPWSVSPNKELLEFIPPEFTSPDRFDTKTNYLVPAAQSWLFENGSSADPTRIADGADNTLILIEVDDSQAVEWTEPKDFAPKPTETFSKYIGHLRDDGTFAVWANGMPVLLETGLNHMMIRRALTHSEDDDLRAVDIHRSIAIEEVDADPDIESDMDVASTLATPGTETVTSPEQSPLEIEEAQYQREAVPTSIELSSAQEKLRQVFRSEFEEAKTTSEKTKLATKFLTTAEEMESDAAGAYVLQAAAMRLATDVGDGQLLVKAIDQRVARFDVDSYEENLTWFREFGEATASKNDSVVDGDALLKRSVPLIFAGIRENEFMEVSAVARIANRFTSNERDDRVSRLLTRLRVQLSVAKREYDKSVTYLEQYRENPENAQAGAAFGRFLCFIKGDWKTGMELIVKGKGSDLVEIVRMDLQGAGTPHAQVEIGDAWWDLSRRGSGAYRQGAQDRAVAWYLQALDRLPESLDRIHVENRIQEADETDGRSPIALCIQLADEVGVDLNQSLTSIAVKGARVGRRNDDDED